ncbi:hypothetical protein CDAR_117061 [Caerostris darwini]|uniref:Uncharacterized protein n=1 Tax=Caerostris darwini TaxID=1538125 RepID=A0AAV4W7L4_9ARAC|nr:hypothetical protein CDAR_117061 [Caerostris darwini]
MCNSSEICRTTWFSRNCGTASMAHYIFSRNQGNSIALQKSVEPHSSPVYVKQHGTSAFIEHHNFPKVCGVPSSSSICKTEQLGTNISNSVEQWGSSLDVQLSRNLSNNFVFQKLWNSIVFQHLWCIIVLQKSVK